jgi:lipoyl-dependent peroxiredoxin
MATRNGSATWTGDLKTGSGELTVGERAWTSAYSGSSRLHGVLPGFEDGAGTNPEELLAAAHAPCFNMALSYALTEAGLAPPRLVRTRARVHLRNVGGAPTIQQIDIETEGMSRDSIRTASASGLRKRRQAASSRARSAVWNRSTCPPRSRRDSVSTAAAVKLDRGP